MLAATLIVAGCTRVSQSPGVQADGDVSVSSLQREAAGLSDVLQTAWVRVDPEPTKDVHSGVFMGFIQSISTESTVTSLVVDFISDKSPQGASTEARASILWSDIGSWNKTAHLQRLRISTESDLFVMEDGLLTYSTSAAFPRHWKDGSVNPGQAYYFSVWQDDDGVVQVSVAWPVPMY
jgi:hypothetical protein